MSIWKQLKEFHESFNLDIGEKPWLPRFGDKDVLGPHIIAIRRGLEHASSQIETHDVRSLRIKLLMEEFAEYLKAEMDDDLIEIADALCDIHYIAAGTEVAYGIPGEEIFNHVHDNNMSKLGPDGKPVYRADGKVLKPDGYQPPNIDEFLGK